MAKPSITNITTTQTFQNWFDKTNDLVDLFRDETLTASASGDSTTGNATLVGDFTATNLVATTALKTDDIQSRNSANPIDMNSPVEFKASQQSVATFVYAASGPQVEFTDNTVTWNMGFKDSSGTFLINTGTGTNKFELSTAGTLAVPNIDVSEGVDIVADLDVGGDARITGGLTVGSFTADNVYVTNDLVVDYVASPSDARLKENLQIIPDALKKVSQINGYTFNYIGKDDRVTGVVAQELERVLPGVVSDVEHPIHGNSKAVRYGNIVALLIEAVKELQGEVERLKNDSSD